MIHTQNRAAVICLGGWGMQVMLHLNLRLQAIQQQRHFTGTNQETPALHDVIRCVTCMPETHYPPASNSALTSYAMMKAYTTNASQYPTAAAIDALVQRSVHNLQDQTHSEAIAKELVSEAFSRRWIQQLEEGVPALAVTPHAARAETHVTRQEYFELMLDHADDIATWLQRDLIEPTLLDRIAPTESLMQTNIYIVASLTEPLTSVMIWPLLAALRNVVGDGRLAQVVGILNIGSFAVGHHIALEAGCVHAALSELEVLTASSSEHDINAIRHEIEKTHNSFHRYKDHYEVFDQLYLLDRNKENFSLAASSSETAITATNFIEASLVSQLPAGISESVLQRNVRDSDAHTRVTERSYSIQRYPYSSFGVYIRNVPLMEYLTAATAVQSSVLRQMLNTEEGAHDQTASQYLVDHALDVDSLQSIIIEHAARQNLLFDQRTAPSPIRTAYNRLWARLPEWVRGTPAPRDGHQPGVHLPEMSVGYYMRELGDIRQLDLYTQRARLLAHRQSFRARLDADIQPRFFETIWGTDFIGFRTQPSALDTHLFTSTEEARVLVSNMRSSTWSERAAKHRHGRIFTRVLHDIMQNVQHDISNQPRGLSMALAYLRVFRRQVVQQHGNGVEDAKLFAEQIQQVDRNLEQRQLEWDATMARHQRRMMRWQYVVAQATIMSVIFVLTTLMLIWQTAPTTDLYTVVALGSLIAAGTYALWFLWMGVQQFRARRLITQLVHIHIEHMTNHVNIIANNGISKLYEAVEQYLTQLLEILETSMRHTFDGYVERNEQTVNHGIADSHVREVIRNTHLWETVNAFVSQQVRKDGKTNSEWFEEHWAKDPMSVARPLNQTVIERTLEIYNNMRMVRLLCEARAIIERYPNQSAIPDDYQRDPEYIAARDRYALLGQSNDVCVVNNLSVRTAHQTDACTVCIRSCALREWNDAQFQTNLAQRQHTEVILKTLPENNFFAGVDGHITRALAYLQDRDGAMIRDAGFTADVVQHYSIESLLTTMFPTAQALDKEVERMTRHAKTSVNYETRDAQDIIETRHVVIADADFSAMKPSFDRRQYVAIAGGDPFNLAVVRTNHMLQRTDFPSCSDANQKYMQISMLDRTKLTIAGFDACYRTASRSSDPSVGTINPPIFAVRSGSPLSQDESTLTDSPSAT